MTKTTTKVDNTLTERGKNYGLFTFQADYAQSLKEVFRDSANWETMANDQKEALDMIANKIGRILNGNPDFVDSWHDISGYATLVEKRLNGEIL